MKVNNIFYYPSANILLIILYRIKLFLQSKYHFMKDYLSNQKEYKRVKKIYNTKKNKKAFVFANGPSINKIDFKKVNNYNYDIFVVNKFFETEKTKDVNVTYHVFSDPRYFELNHRYYQTFNNSLKKDHQIFLPFNYLSKFKSNDPKFFGFCDVENFLSNNVDNIVRPRGYISMTAFKALSIALYMGYEEIYICGFDNNQYLEAKSDINNSLFYTNLHFYKKEVNDPDNRQDVKKDWSSNNGYLMYTEHFLFTHLDKFAQTKKSIIKNLDPESLCISFSKDHNLDIYL